MQRAQTSYLGRAPPNPFDKIPRYIQFTSPVSNAPGDDVPRANSLPLNLIGHIVSYLDDIGDIARVTRTSRLLYYMTLPQLYERVQLHSYNEIRYVNGKPEGYGSGSPFTMALNGLITKQHATLVQEFRVWGQWKEMGVEDFSQGRVPDNSMMLNILVRAATDRMSKLQSFCWELDCKPLKTLYQGLASHQTLTSLTLRFPSTRIPRPSVLIPPIPNLRVFKALDIDPLCYPDDISLLLLHSRKLEDLRLHFSPRMRQESEAVVHLDSFFGRCQKAGYKIKLKHFGMQNFFGINTYGTTFGIDVDVCESVTFIDTFGGPDSDPRNIFVDDTWALLHPEVVVSYKSSRINVPAKPHVELMRRATKPLENLYIINEKRARNPGSIHSTPHPMTPDTNPRSTTEIAALKDEYIHAIVNLHGASMRRLLLCDQWALSAEDVGSLVRNCPDLEQIGLAIDSPNHDILRLLLPFLTKLRAVRILKNEHLVEHFRMVSQESRMLQISVDLAQTRESIEFLGIGDYIYHCGDLFQDVDANGESYLRRKITMATIEDVSHLEIWHMDSLDISRDPIAPFST